MTFFVLKFFVLKEVPQNFTEFFKVDDVTANDVIRRNQHRKEKKLT